MASCYNAINEDAASDPNLVKVVHDTNDNAIYFSRSLIPYNQGGEDIEKLEQLRAIYHGKKISMVKVASTGFGIDTKEDLARAIEIFL